MSAKKRVRIYRTPRRAIKFIERELAELKVYDYASVSGCFLESLLANPPFTVNADPAESEKEDSE